MLSKGILILCSKLGVLESYRNVSIVSSTISSISDSIYETTRKNLHSISHQLLWQHFYVVYEI